MRGAIKRPETEVVRYLTSYLLIPVIEIAYALTVEELETRTALKEELL